MGRITVITSAYKRPKELERAIKSVDAQTYKDWEHIIVSDGKKAEKLAEVVAGYPDKRRRYIELEHSGSDAKPKNTGIKEAQGEYVAFLDDDNEYLPNFLETLLTEAEINDDDVVWGDARMFGKKIPKEGQPAIAMDYDPQFLLNRNYIDFNNVLVKKEALFEVGGIDETLPRFKDWNLFVRMSKAGMKMRHIPIYLTKYHVTKGNSAAKHPVHTWTEPSTGLTMFAATWFHPSSCYIRGPWLGGKEKKPKVATLMLTKDRVEYTIRTLESIKSSTKYPIDLYIYDNGSKDNTIEAIKKFAEKNSVVLEQGEEVKCRASNEIAESVDIQEACDCSNEREDKKGNEGKGRFCGNKREVTKGKLRKEGISIGEEKYEQGTQRSSYPMDEETKNKRGNKKSYGDEENKRYNLQKERSSQLEERTNKNEDGVLSQQPKEYARASGTNGEPFGEKTIRAGSSASYQREQRGQHHRELASVQESIRTHETSCPIKKITLIKSKKNTGITTASNACLDAIGKDYDIIVKIDNDVEFLTKNWLEDFIDLWKRNHMLYLGPYPEGLVDIPGGPMRVGHATLGEEYVEVTQHISGFCAFIDARAYLYFRWQDKFLHGIQDKEFSEYVRKQGYMPAIIPRHRVRHMDSTSGQWEKYKEYFEQRKYEKTHHAVK